MTKAERLDIQRAVKYLYEDRWDDGIRILRKVSGMPPAPIDTIGKGTISMRDAMLRATEGHEAVGVGDG